MKFGMVPQPGDPLTYAKFKSLNVYSKEKTLLRSCEKKRRKIGVHTEASEPISFKLSRLT